MNTLFLITARGGSKGLPGKNIKPLAGKPLLHYTIEAARGIVRDENICLSTDDELIIQTAKEIGLEVPFTRPASLASDTASSYDVILHALNFYEQQQQFFDTLVLLQPTSPFRSATHIRQALDLYDASLDMVVSVKKTHANPYFNLFEENAEGFLEISKKSDYTRRQDAPAAYEFNGAIYIINTKSVKQSPLNQFKKVKKYVMSELDSIDIDAPFEWLIAEMVIEKRLVKHEA